MSTLASRALGLLLALGALTPAVPAQQSAPPAADTAVSRILDGFFAAAGGRALWTRPTIVAREYDRPAGGGTFSHTWEVRDRRSGRSYIRVVTPDGVVTERGFDGRRGWELSPRMRGYRDVTGGAKAITSTGPDRLRDYVVAGYRVARAADVVFDGAPALALVVTDTSLRGEPFPVRFYLDARTLLVRATEQHGAVQRFDDYRVVDGRRVPFQTSNTMLGTADTLRIKTIVYDAAADDGLFTLPTRAPNAPPPPLQLRRAPDAPRPAAPALDDSVRRATFDVVARTVAQRYWDTTFNGRDWPGIVRRYATRLDEPDGSDAFHALLTRMVLELGVSHFAVTPRAHAERPAGVAWFTVRSDGGDVVVLQVDSATRAAGLRPGMAIDAIDGRSVRELSDRHRARGTWWPVGKAQGREEAVLRAAEGRPGDTVRITVRETDSAGAARVLAIPLSPRASRPLATATAARAVHARRLASGVGYIGIDVFFSDVGRAVGAALDTLRGSRGIVLDLRGNPGGDAKLLRDVAAHFYAGPGTLGTVVMRYGRQELAYAGAGDAAYRGPLVVLVDGWSGSCSEVLAAALQESGRAAVVGDTTAGGALPSQQLVLPSGGVMQFPIADFRTARGRRLEGAGVAPDVVVPYRAVALRRGIDEAVERAERLAQTQTR